MIHEATMVNKNKLVRKSNYNGKINNNKSKKGLYLGVNVMVLSHLR